MRILFMGTPDFAVETFNVLLESKHEIIGVVTQPDKPKGREGSPKFSPVKEAAVAANLPVYQPHRVGDEAFIHTVRSLWPDVIVVVAYGQILPVEILEAPLYGCLNVHASLLPRLRGAAPIQWSVIQGDAESGVTIQQMDEGLDTGDILAVKKVTLEPKETGGSLFEKLAKFGGPMILDVLDQLEAGTVTRTPQNNDEHTYAKILSKLTGYIDFNRSAVEIERLIRGLNPWPSAYCYLEDKLLKIWEADVIEGNEYSSGEGTAAGENTTDAAENTVSSGEQPVGAVVSVEKDAFVVKTGDGFLKVYSVQLEGKKRMDCASFLRGHALSVGTVLAGKNS